ncbi:DUF2625 family protein [Lentzea sp. NPDC059081]|uniref:DUF2625 family protein n=1 Tax=Lentzea sp. NPDC059081 TaxID=3346719 RepID=UPI0036B6CB7E
MKTSAWEAVTRAITESPYRITVLAPAQVADDGTTPDSWLGAVITHTGGLLVDGGRLRVFGSGSGSVPAVHPAETGGLVVADSVRGDRFALVVNEKGRQVICHLAPGLVGESLDLGYTNWLGAMLAGSLDEI